MSPSAYVYVCTSGLPLTFMELAVTVRYQSRLHHIGIGRAHKNRPIKLRIADRNIRIIDPKTGQLIRQLTLDPNHDYQPIRTT